MPVASSVYNLGLCALVALLLTAIAATATVRTRAGSALAALLVLVAAAYIACIILNAPLVSDPATYLAGHRWAGMGTAFAVEADLVLFCLASAATLVTVVLARHWRWLASVVAALLPMGVLVLGGLVPESPSTYARDVVPFSAALFCPLLVGLAYALSRWRPQPPAGAAGS